MLYISEYVEMVKVSDGHSHNNRPCWACGDLDGCHKKGNEMIYRIEFRVVNVDNNRRVIKTFEKYEEAEKFILSRFDGDIMSTQALAIDKIWTDHSK